MVPWEGKAGRGEVRAEGVGGCGAGLGGTYEDERPLDADGVDQSSREKTEQSHQTIAEASKASQTERDGM